MNALKVLLIPGIIGLASGHGNIVKPPAWFHRCTVTDENKTIVF